MILVTGATGFVGRHVVQELLSSGHSVRAMVHTPARASVLPNDRLEAVQGDVMNPASLTDAVAGVETVVHLVAVIRESRDLTFQRVNYEGTRNVLAAAASAGVKRIIDASAIGATSDPSIPYLYSRWMAEQEVIRSGVPYTIIRFSFAFGDGDEFINRLAALVKLSPIVPVIGNGRNLLQPIAVEDVARCLALACETEEAIGKTIEVGGPDQYTYRETLDLVAETLGAKTVKINVPIAVMSPWVALMGAFVSRPPVTSDQLKMLRFDNVAELDSVKKAFGFDPRPLNGNIDYVSRISLVDALKMNLGIMPAHIRDH